MNSERFLVENKRQKSHVRVPFEARREPWDALSQLVKLAIYGNMYNIYY